MSDQNLQNFIGLSAVLTGLSAKLLRFRRPDQPAAGVLRHRPARHGP
jgi:hypothetical protein